MRPFGHQVRRSALVNGAGRSGDAGRTTPPWDGCRLCGRRATRHATPVAVYGNPGDPYVAAYQAWAKWFWVPSTFYSLRFYSLGREAPAAASTAFATAGRTPSMSATDTAPADSLNQPVSSVTPNAWNGTAAKLASCNR